MAFGLQASLLVFQNPAWTPSQMPPVDPNATFLTRALSVRGGVPQGRVRWRQPSPSGRLNEPVPASDAEIVPFHLICLINKLANGLQMACRLRACLPKASS